MSILGIIPARYASSRFPGKPLVEISGKSMIHRVCEQALQSEVFSDIIVATDDETIFKHVESTGFHAVMTSTTHRSGTDRCTEALGIWEHTQKTTFDHVINIQGDEPFIHPDQIRKIASMLEHGHAPIATLAKLITKAPEIADPNVVKVVFNREMNALYFSRSPIPQLRGTDEGRWVEQGAHYKHIGIYGFQSDALNKACMLPEGKLEKHESLEQLRWLEYGMPIKIDLTDFESISIDTPEDLLKITNTP